MLIKSMLLKMDEDKAVEVSETAFFCAVVREKAEFSVQFTCCLQCAVALEMRAGSSMGPSCVITK